MSTGPFILNRPTPAGSIYRVWHRSSRPYREQLPFYSSKMGGIQAGQWGGPDTAYSKPRPEGDPYVNWLGRDADPSIWDGELKTKLQSANATAFDKLASKVKNSASLATSLAEAGQSLKMIDARALQLFRAARALKRGRLGDFALNLKLDPNRVRRKVEGLGPKAKDLSNVWLEFTFGWKPLIQDIGDCVKVLQQDFRTTPVKGRSSFSYSSESNSEDFAWLYAQDANLDVKVQYRCSVRFDSPNLLLANSLGFVNPASVAWELVPFSFVLDWFVPVGRFLESFTDFVGMTVSDMAYSVTRNARGTATSKHRYSPLYHHTQTCYAGSFVRKPLPQLPVPGLMSRVKLPEASPWLAATSLSLLTQMLPTLSRR